MLQTVLQILFQPNIRIIYKTIHLRQIGPETLKFILKPKTVMLPHFQEARDTEEMINSVILTLIQDRALIISSILILCILKVLHHKSIQSWYQKETKSIRQKPFSLLFLSDTMKKRELILALRIRTQQYQMRMKRVHSESILLRWHKIYVKMRGSVLRCLQNNSYRTLANLTIVNKIALYYQTIT